MLLVTYFTFLISHLVAVKCECMSNAVLPVYSDTVTEHGYKYERLFVNKSNPVKVTFRVPVESSLLDDMEWHNRGKILKIDTNPNNNLYYSIEPEQGSSIVSLHFRAPTARISGKWKLEVTSDQQKFASVCDVTSHAVIKRTHGAKRVNEGQPLSVTCTIDTYPPPTELKWQKVVFSPDDSAGAHLEPVVNATFKEHDGLANGVMEFASSTGQGGFYVCAAVSLTHQDNWLIEVRVKDYRTILWPCLGILIQLVVLGIIIGVYEYLQSKRRKADEKQLKGY